MAYASRKDDNTLIESKMTGEELNLFTDSYRDPLLGGTNRGDFKGNNSTVNKSDDEEKSPKRKKHDQESGTRDQTMVIRSIPGMELTETKENRFRKTNLGVKRASAKRPRKRRNSEEKK